MALWGAFQRGLYAWLQRSAGDRSTVLLYAALLLASPTMMAIQGNLLQFVLPVYVLLIFMGYRARARRTVTLAEAA